MKWASELLIGASLEMSGKAPVQAVAGKYSGCLYDVSVSEAWK